MIILFIPSGELPQSFPECYLRCKPEVTLQSCGIGIRRWHIPWLHGNQFLVCLEVKICRKDTSSYQFLLQNLYEVEQILRLATTYIIYCVWWDGQSVLTLLTLWSTLHHTNHTFHDVIYVGEVTTAVAVVEYLDGFALQQFVGETKVCHIWTTGRAIYREKAQARCGDVIQL